MGVLGWTPKVFYRATLAELFDAIKARRESDEQHVQLFLFGVRKVAYYAAAPHVKNLKETNILELDIDKKIKKNRFKNTKPMEVTIDGKKQ